MHNRGDICVTALPSLVIDRVFLFLQLPVFLKFLESELLRQDAPPLLNLIQIC